MKIVTSNDQFPSEFHNAVVAIGNFDGVHLGHRELILSARSKASEKGAKFGVITFNPHPCVIFGRDCEYIYDTEYKYQVLEELNLDFVYEIAFNENIASIPPEDFVATYLVTEMKISHIITGFNYRFGKKRAGDPQMLQELSRKHGFTYSQIGQISSEHLSVSSSAIKQLLKEGRIERASNLMKRPYVIVGNVIAGKNIAGKLLECSTANIATPQNMVMPKYGVYLVSVTIEDGRHCHGIANIGLRPTVNDGLDTLLEVHLFDFDDNIFSKKLKVEFIAFVRPERKFPNLDALKIQIQNDIKNARYLLREIKP